jgi:hypothetical protein
MIPERKRSEIISLLLILFILYESAAAMNGPYHIHDLYFLKLSMSQTANLMLT